MDLWQDPVTYAIPVFVLTLAAEALIGYYSKRSLYNYPEALASIAMGIGVAIIGAGVKAVALVGFYGLYQYAPESWAGWLGFGNPWAWVLCLLADDFSFYWHHRLSHSVRILWAAHENHHSARSLNLAVALRQSWTEVFYKFFFWAWMPLLGFHPLMILMMMSISLIYQYFQHTELIGKLGPLEWILNTPSHHRVHHATNVRYLDRNHAGMLIIWDRLFGTFVAEDPAEKPVYGIRKDFHSNNPLRIATHEFVDIWRDVRRAKGLRNKLGYIFGPPGWQPGDSSQTTRALQRRQHLQEPLSG